MIWKAFTALFGSKFTSGFGSLAESGPHWDRVLADLTGKQLDLGLRRVERSGREWPPSAPEFRDICLRPELPEGFPSVEKGFSEFKKYLQSSEHMRRLDMVSPVLRHLIRKHLNMYDVKQVGSDKLFPMFKRAYDATLDDLREGKNLDAEVKPLPKLEKLPFERTGRVEKAKERAVGNIRSMFE